jgi:hypothetical protein
MKSFLITAGIILVLGAIFLAFVKKSINDTEEQAYTVLRNYEGFEIRQYAPALYSSVKLNASNYKDVSSVGFRTLAGYIFGGNETQEKIAMTSPVTMELEDTSKMMFMVPSHMKREDLPTPNNSSIYFEEYPTRIVAAITFGGWVNDDKLQKYTHQLVELLQQEGIEHLGNFAYLGYNPPYDVVNRRNEVIVEVVWK